MNVTEMLRTTGTNTAEFMNKIADHIEQLEATILQLQARIAELENGPKE